MAENTTFNTADNQTIGRHLMVVCLNTGSATAPVWSPVGKRVSNSNMEYDWQKESITDILNNIWTNMKTPVVTQAFDAWPLTKGDPAVVKIWNTGIWEQNAPALCAMDMLILHKYSGTANTAVGAEHYTACAVEPTSLGGDGGGNLNMTVNVTYGGERTVGTAAIDEEGVITYTPAKAS